MAISYKKLGLLMTQVRSEKQIRGKHTAMARLAILLIEYAGYTFDDLIEELKKEAT